MMPKWRRTLLKIQRHVDRNVGKPWLNMGRWGTVYVRLMLAHYEEIYR